MQSASMTPRKQHRSRWIDHLDTNNYSVTLAGSAEQNATALNIVNSAGGMVANGVNIAHSTNLNAMPTLTQINSISQTR